MLPSTIVSRLVVKYCSKGKQVVPERSTLKSLDNVSWYRWWCHMFVSLSDIPSCYLHRYMHIPAYVILHLKIGPRKIQSLSLLCQHKTKKIKLSEHGLFVQWNENRKLGETFSSYRFHLLLKGNTSTLDSHSPRVHTWPEIVLPRHNFGQPRNKHVSYCEPKIHFVLK